MQGDGLSVIFERLLLVSEMGVAIRDVVERNRAAIAIVLFRTKSKRLQMKLERGGKIIQPRVVNTDVAKHVPQTGFFIPLAEGLDGLRVILDSFFILAKLPVSPGNVINNNRGACLFFHAVVNRERLPVKVQSFLVIA